MRLRSAKLKSLLATVCGCSAANAFSFSFLSTPTQCANTTVQWDGGQPPFTLLLVPVGHVTPEIRTIQQFTVTSGMSVSFVLPFPTASQFVAVMNDATGIGSGGTSIVTTVAGSPNAGCLNTQQSAPKFYLFLDPTDIGQCEQVDISWQNANADPPVDILALIPGGQSFEILNETDPDTSSFQWSANVREGTDMLLVAGDKDGLGTGGSTDVMPVGDGDDDCINESSPSSTAGPAAGGVSTGGISGGGTGGTATGGSAGATGTGGSQGTGATGVGTDGGSGGSTATDGGDGGSGVTGTGGNPGSPSSDFPGSGGGTVTGNPDANGGKRNNLALILGTVLGLLALLGFGTGAYLLYRRRQRHLAASYANLEPPRARPGILPTTFPASWRNRLASSIRPGPAAASNNSRMGRMRYWAAHLRGGVASSVEGSTTSLPSMYQTDPFILPPEPAHAHAWGGWNAGADEDTAECDEPFTPPLSSSHGASAGHPHISEYTYAAVPPERQPTIVPLARGSSTGGRSLRSFLNDIPYARDASVLDWDDPAAVALMGEHGPPVSASADSQRPGIVTAEMSSEERKRVEAASSSSSQRYSTQSLVPPPVPTRRTPSGRVVPSHTIRIPPLDTSAPATPNRVSGLPPPAPVGSPTRVTRDSMDFSLEPEEVSPNPFGEEFVEIPPTYHSVREVTMRTRAGSGSHAREALSGVYGGDVMSEPEQVVEAQVGAGGDVAAGGAVMGGPVRRQGSELRRSNALRTASHRSNRRASGDPQGFSALDGSTDASAGH